MVIGAGVQQVNVIPQDGGVLDLLFHHSWININLLGFFDKTGGFLITLSGLIVLVVISLAAAAISERLAGEKPGKNLATNTLITLLGAYIFVAYVNLPFTDVAIEGIRIVAALLGAIVFGVFWVLIRKQSQSQSKKA